MRVVALAGGTGGAKLAHGLQAVLDDGELTVVANTGDDTERHGLLVMPDHDALLYMLSGRFDDDRGWGQRGETWTVMEALAEYGEEDWFRLGDRDFATHIARTARIREGRTLTEAVLSLQDARSASRAGSCRWPMRRSAPRCASTRAGSTSRSTSSIAARGRRSARSGSAATPADRGGRRGHRGGRRDRHRAVEPDRLDRPDPGRADPGSRHGTGARRRPGRGDQPDHRWRGAQGAGRSDARLARPRIERPGSGQDLPWCRHGLRARHARRRARTRDREPRLPDTGRRHRHGRPPRPCPTRARRPRVRGCRGRRPGTPR